MAANKMDFLIITFLIYKEEIETQYSVKQIHFIIQDGDTFDSLIEMFQLRAFTPNISQQYKMIDKRKHIPSMHDNSFKDYYFSTWPRAKIIYLVL